jgi:hypothetical protein
VKDDFQSESEADGLAESVQIKTALAKKSDHRDEVENSGGGLVKASLDFVKRGAGQGEHSTQSDLVEEYQEAAGKSLHRPIGLG